MILTFVSIQTVEEDLTLKDAVALALAADEFLLNLLKSFCASEIKRLVTVETVWTTLNSIVRIQDLPDACFELLSLETKKCLEHETFLEASEESLIFLLEMETLAIDSELDLIEAAVKLAKSKSEKGEVTMMEAAIRNLRLLTLPMDKLDQLATYLSDSQMCYLAKRLIFKLENSDAKVSPLLNLSTSSRRRPAIEKKIKFEFVAEDLIKSDWEMINSETKKCTTWNTLQIELVAEQHLVLKGIEILTRANNSPKIEIVRHNGEPSSRILTLQEEYQENVTVNVFITLKGAKTKNIFHSEIKSKNEFNSWFYVDFGMTVFVPKGADFSIDVRSSNVYQLVPFAHIKQNIDKAEKCAEFSKFKFNYYEQEKRGDEIFPKKCLEMDVDHFFSIKSLSVVPVDEQGCLSTE